MKKLVSRWRIAISSSLILGAMAVSPAMTAATASKAPAVAAKAVSATMKLSSFDSIDASGNLHLTLLSGGNTSTHTLHITHASNQQFDIAVKNHVLTIKQTTPWWQPTKPADVSVDISQLKKLTVVDAVSVSAKKFKSPALAIDADTSGSIDIDGAVGLTSIVSKGPGDINISWVDSPQLSIDSNGDGKITLSGKVDDLQAKLSGHSILKAQYLRADSVMVQTHRFSRAMLMPLTSLHAYANGYSNIFYYKTPKNFTSFTSESGNVLQLQWRQQ